MSNKLDIDDLFGPRDDPKPVNKEAKEDGSLRTQQPRASVLPFMGWALAIFFAALYISSLDSNPGPNPKPKPNPDIKVDGPTVLITRDEEDRSISDGQAIVLNTTKVQTYCEENKILYRLIDVNDSTEKMEPFWGELVKAAHEPPALTIASTEGMITAELPSSIEATIKGIEDGLHD